MELKRIQKVLSDNGIMSRRKAEAAITAGKITVNGHPAQLGQKIDARVDLVAVEGKNLALLAQVRKVYLMLNKPRGWVTTLSDEMGRKCVAQLVENAPAKVYPVGRLDKDSEGLLLFTNDGDFANLMMHPSHHVSKTYRVTVKGPVSEDALVKLAAGVQLEDGITAPAQVLVLEKTPQREVLQIVIHEGRNRQVRRMCEAVGIEVMRLRRSMVGPQKLGMLSSGKWRELTPAELSALRSAASSKKGG